MKKSEIDKITDLNTRLLLVLGYAMGFVMNVPLPTPESKKKYDWLCKAVENLVYLDKPLPSMP